MPRPPILPLLMAALVAACGSARDEATAAGHVEARLANMQASLAALGPPAAELPQRVVAAVDTVRPRLAEAVATTPEAPRLHDLPAPVPPHQGQAPRETAQLLGRTPDHLLLWLGEPLLRRAEGSGAEIWLYAAEACALDLVLYRDRGGPMRVAFAAARAAGDGAERRTEAECLGRIAAGPAARPAT